MNNGIIEHISKIVSLNNQEIEVVLNSFSEIKLSKKSKLLSENQICRHLYYVKSGCLRLFSINENGTEDTLFFAIEDYLISDLKSFIDNSSARYVIDTLEDSNLLQITKPQFDLLLEKIPKLEKWYRVLLQNALIYSENRISYKSSFNAEERYLKFLEKYPNLENRIPQRRIASYLGISPEFLSTIKSNRLKKEKP